MTNNLHRKSLATAVRSLSLGFALTSGLWGQSVTNTYTLPDLDLAAFQNALLPGSITDGRNFLLGGVGSGLWRHPNDDAPNTFWMITDRGPNGLVGAQRTFPVPGFTPTILHVRAEGTGLTILDKFPLVGHSGAGVTGLSNSTRDEVPYLIGIDPNTGNCAVITSPPFPYNPNGFDTEDLVRRHDGTFWLVEEYGPSIVKVSPTGIVLNRFVPNISAPWGTDFVVTQNLPAIYGFKRKQNRGFEGLALTPNQKTLFAALQSPLVNPTNAIGNASRNTRILAFDLDSESPNAEYVYRFQPSTEFGSTNAADMKVSAIASINDRKLLVLERTDAIAKIYRVDTKDATNILGSQWDEVATTPSLEALSDPATAGVTVLPKELIVDLNPALLPGVPQKIEGMIIVDQFTIAISNDNDFDIFPTTIPSGPSCNNVGQGVKSKLLLIHLTQPLF